MPNVCNCHPQHNKLYIVIIMPFDKIIRGCNNGGIDLAHYRFLYICENNKDYPVDRLTLEINENKLTLHNNKFCSS